MLLYSLIFLGCTKSASQEKPKNAFLESFPKTQDEIIDFREVTKKSTPMTRGEGVKYAYYGDSSRLFCLQKSINMENEREFKILRALYLPKKCFVVHYESYSVFGYLKYNCRNLKQTNSEELMLKIIDRNELIRDSLSVFISDAFETSKSGLMNKVARKIFVTGNSEGTSSQASLYTIDSKSLSFRLTMRIDLNKSLLEKKQYGLEEIGWVGPFQTE